MVRVPVFVSVGLCVCFVVVYKGVVCGGKAICGKARMNTVFPLNRESAGVGPVSVIGFIQFVNRFREVRA